MPYDPVNRAEVEDFLFHEADLLDSWRLLEWLELFTQDCRYLVPSAGLPEGALPEETLFYIADDRVLLEERVKRLYKRNAYAEMPHSKTCHLIGNTRVYPGENLEETIVRCAFITHRSRGEETKTFVGKSSYRLVRQNNVLRIREKRCELNCDNLHELGRISIIL